MLTLDLPKDADELRRHLFLFHGVYVEDEKRKEGLEDCHRSCHTEQEIGTPIPHGHTRPGPRRATGGARRPAGASRTGSAA